MRSTTWNHRGDHGTHHQKLVLGQVLHLMSWNVPKGSAMRGVASVQWPMACRPCFGGHLHPSSRGKGSVFVLSVFTIVHTNWWQNTFLICNCICLTCFFKNQDLPRANLGWTVRVPMFKYSLMYNLIKLPRIMCHRQYRNYSYTFRGHCVCVNVWPGMSL